VNITRITRAALALLWLEHGRTIRPEITRRDENLQRRAHCAGTGFDCGAEVTVVVATALAGAAKSHLHSLATYHRRYEW